MPTVTGCDDSGGKCEDAARADPFARLAPRRGAARQLVAAVRPQANEFVSGGAQISVSRLMRAPP